MIGFFDGSCYSNFRDIAHFFDYTLAPRFSGWRFFAHFGGKYDIHHLFDWIRKNRPGLDISFYVSGSAVISFVIRIGKFHWKFSDSYRLMASSLYDLTHQFDVDHKKLEADYQSVEYNRHDCIGLYEVLQKFFAVFNITRETIAAQSMAVFRRYYLDREIWQPPRAVEDFIRSGYYGGRVEVYRHDEKSVNEYDVNSLYPYAMLGPVPVDYIGKSTRLPDDDDKIGFFDSEIDYPDCYLPALPALFAGKLFFPIGKFRGVFSSIELREAIRAGAAVKIRSGYLFMTDSIFTAFVNDLYEMRMKAKAEGNYAMFYACKLIMNALYGKFGQGREQACYILDPGTARLDMDDSTSPAIFPLPDGLAYYFRECHATHLLPHISASITSRARTITRNYLEQAGRVWYSDTDSIFTPSRLPLSEGLGGLKLVKRGSFQAYGLKEYKFADHYSIKGVSVKREDPATGKKIEDPLIAERYLAGDMIPIERRAGFIESIRAGLPTLRRIQTFKQRHKRLEKRARVKFDTRPWNAKEIEGMI